MCQLCCNPAGEKSCCCFNLSIALLVIAAYFGLIGGLDIYQADQVEPRSQLQYVGGIFNCAIAGYICLCVLLGFLKLRLLAYVATFVCFAVTLLNALYKLFSFIKDWVDWGTGLSDGTIKFQWVMVSYTITQLLTIVVVLGFANLFWSAACVFKAGGNGCEFKTYKQIEAENETARNKQQDRETSTEV